MKPLLLILLFCGSVYADDRDYSHSKSSKSFKVVIPSSPTAVVKFPLEIEWECYKKGFKYHGFDESTLSAYIDYGCIRWIGFREDGVVVWRKEDEHP
jgi:hypothetical protein